MQTLVVHRQLIALVSNIHSLTERVRANAATEEVALRVAATREVLDQLQHSIDSGPTGPFNSFARHLHFLLYYYRAAAPEAYAPDLADLLERDMPGVLVAVEEWGHEAMDEGLWDAVCASWEARHYGNAVRDAFVYLEDVLRAAGGLDPTEGLSGDRLVARVLGPNAEGPPPTVGGFLGSLTRGEAQGVHHLLKGSFLLLRNATAHRAIPYTASEAQDVLHLVNLCLRVVAPAGE